MIAVAVLAVVELLIVTQVVFAQAPAVKEETTLQQMSQVVGVISSIGILLAVLFGFAWFIWKGKDAEQQAKTIASLQDELKEQRSKVADLRIEKAEALTAKEKLENLNKQITQNHENEMEEMRKMNFRLQGKRDAD